MEQEVLKQELEAKRKVDIQTNLMCQLEKEKVKCMSKTYFIQQLKEKAQDRSKRLSECRQ